MTILLLSPFLPYPLSQGGKIRVFNIIKHLSKRGHRITLACLTEKETKDYGPLAEICAEIVCVEKKRNLFRDLPVFLFGGRPFNYIRFSSGAFRKALELLLRKRRFDLVHIEFSLMWQYADIFAGIPAVLGEQNIEFEIVRQIGTTQRSPLKKLLYLREERKLRRKEEKAWRECDLCIAVSEKEREAISSHCDPGKVFTLPNGVDLERFEFLPKTAATGEVLFVGGLDYRPNLDSAQYFLDEIYPLMRAGVSTVHLTIVGRELSRIAGRVASGDFELHENVPDIVPFFRKADVLVVPLRCGGGTRIKILEAMAAGLPVVSTSKGCEGLDVKDGEHLLVADTPASFAAAVGRVLSDRALTISLTGNARDLVGRKYSWEIIAKEMEEIYGTLGAP